MDETRGKRVMCPDTEIDWATVPDRLIPDARGAERVAPRARRRPPALEVREGPPADGLDRRRRPVRRRRALPVLLALKAKADARRETWVKPPAAALQDLGIGRMARSRAIAALERAGLVRGAAPSRAPASRAARAVEGGGRWVALCSCRGRSWPGPHTAPHSTGTSRLGLLARDERTGRWRGLSPDELRRGYPEAWWMWTRFAALLPSGTSERLPRPGGGHAA